MAYFCVINPAGAQSYPAPDKTKPMTRVPAGAIIVAIGKISNGGFEWVVSLDAKNLPRYIDAREIVRLDEI